MTVQSPSQTIDLVIISSLILLSELSIYLFGPKIGIIENAAILTLIIAEVTLTERLGREFLHVFQAMILVPVYRIITLSTPPEIITYNGYLLLTTVAILAGTMILITATKLTLGDVGMRLRDSRLQILCITAGPFIGYLEWTLLKPAGSVAIMPGILILTLTAFTEELIFRGLLQQSIERAVKSPPFAILLTTILYTTFFISYASGRELILVLLTSLLFGYTVSRSRSVVGVAISHALLNVVSLLILPIYA
ncbi:CAAX protease self-immunity [Candidatus Methanoperedenaceae archaeon GB50]|nr:CAAX protease self-immunity [Candidatus Methanoperedenaceae archaeon GB50]CAD7773532.1 MAG: CAAX protease self-immunity [Candidatus Methanoperedenaceae archaeon GB50]